MTLNKVATLGIASMLVVTPLIAGEFSHTQLGLRFRVPDDFVEVPEREQGAIVFAFTRPANNLQVSDVILVKRLGGVLERERPDPKELSEKAPGATITTEKWKEFEINVSRIPQKVDDVQLVTIVAEVPLKREAVQIGVGGDASREDEFKSILRSILATVEGETNWLTWSERGERLGKLVMQVVVPVVVGIGFVLWWAIRRRKINVTKRTHHEDMPGRKRGSGLADPQASLPDTHPCPC